MLMFTNWTRFAVLSARARRARVATPGVAAAAVASLLFAHRAEAQSPGTVTPLVPERSTPLTDKQREHAAATLRWTLREQPKWIKVHAAEFLLAVNLPEGVVDEFREELARHAGEPQYRIGIWRVLYRCPALDEEQAGRLELIVTAALDPSGPDRLHAIEALAKLDTQLTPGQQELIRQWVEAAAAADAPFGRWLLARQPNADRQLHLQALLKIAASDVPLERLRASYALARLTPLSKDDSAELLQLAAAVAGSPLGNDPLQPLADAYLLAAGWGAAVRSDAEAAEKLREALQSLAGSSPAINRVLVDQLAELGDADEVELLVPLLDNADPDLAASAAHALLRIKQRALADSN